MDAQWLSDTVAGMRQIGNDTQTCEVKEAKGGLPSSMAETLSAFSNGPGGFVILGLSERDGFAPVAGFDARKAQDALCAECEKLSPTVRPQIEVLPFEGSLVVCARVPEMHPRDKPCHIRARSRYDGSFVRTGDGDRRMTPYEVDRLMEEHRQPTHDNDAVEEADLGDFDAALLDGFIRRQRELHPRILGARTDEDIVLDLHVVRRVDGKLRPTVAGLMALGGFPQRHLPRLNVTFTAFPGTTKTERVDDRRRFLDAKTLVGPIPTMIDDALSAVEMNTRTGAVVEGAFRRDVPDYPREAVREAVANALMHRDYSPESRGSQVQVNLYADRLEVLNPGGLYGDVTIDTLGTSGVSSARNQFLSNILETTPYPGGGYVVENRGTGYQEIEYRLREAGMEPASPRGGAAWFSLTFYRRKAETAAAVPTRRGTAREAIVGYLGGRSSATAREIAEALGLSRSSVTSNLRALVNEGTVGQAEPDRSPKQRYRLTGTQGRTDSRHLAD